MRARFERWCAAVGELPRRQTRVLTWPIVTVFGFIAQPDAHIFRSEPSDPLGEAGPTDR